MSDRIGQWAHRARDGKSHLVESRINDGFVMRCGTLMAHQLGKSAGGALIFEDSPPWGFPACEKCTGPHVPTMNTRSIYP